MAKLRSITNELPTEMVYVGNVGIGRCSDAAKTLWMEINGGEGMQVKGDAAAKLEQILEDFFKEHF